MSLDFSAINLNLVVWLVVIILVVGLVFGIFRFFFSHLLHLFFRGCGLVVFLVILYLILHYLKIF